MVCLDWNCVQKCYMLWCREFCKLQYWFRMCCIQSSYWYMCCGL